MDNWAYIMVLCCFVGLSDEANILILPFQFKSTTAQMKYIGQALVDRGHKVDMVLPTTYEDSFKTTGINFIHYTLQHHDNFENPENVPEDLFDEFSSKSQIDEKMDPLLLPICLNLLDSDIKSHLKENKYDVAIVHTFMECRCYLIIPYNLDIPVVSVTTFFEPWQLRSPNMPSFVPFAYTTPQVSPNMNYYERIKNLWTLFSFTYFSDSFPTVSHDLVKKYAPEKPFVSINELETRSAFWLIDSEILLDYPKPVMPNMAEIAGVSVKPARPLPNELEEFITSFTGPVIVASFGSIQFVPLKHMTKLLEAFKMLSSNTPIILRWSLKTTPTVPSNIKLMKWIPQSDILGHNRTRLFITHGGTNSQMEALYHGVPMLTMPVNVDQPYNAKRAEYHGFSKTFDFKTFTPKELSSCINEMLANPAYSASITKSSAILHSRPMNPLQVAVHHIEQAIMFGGNHLRAHAFDIPAYQYLMLDIFLPLIFGAYTVISILSYLVYNLFWKQKPKSRKG